MMKYQKLTESVHQIVNDHYHLLTQTHLIVKSDIYHESVEKFIVE